jgi:hypothetical protein
MAPSSPPPSPPPKSPPSRPAGSGRHVSLSAAARRGDHAPANPSGLRRSIVPQESTSPEDDNKPDRAGNGNADGKRPTAPDFEEGGIIPPQDQADTDEYPADQYAEPSAFWNHEHGLRARLLGQDNWDAASGCGSEYCRHGTLSPRPLSPTRGSYGTYGSFSSSVSQQGFGGAYTDGDGPEFGDSADATHGLLGDTIADGLLGGGTGNKMSTTDYLARRHGIRVRRRMSVPILYLMKRFIANKFQVLVLLHPVLQLDNTVQAGISKGRLHCCFDSGVLLHSHVSLLRLESWTHPSRKRPLQFRLQSYHICSLRHLTLDGRRARSSRLPPYRSSRSREHQ